MKLSEQMNEVKLTITDSDQLTCPFIDINNQA